jgi:hypothetical protein
MAKSTHGTLSANTVASVSITPGSEGIVVVNRTLSGEIWVRIDGVDPQIAGDGSYVVIGAREFPMSLTDVRKGTVNVRLISDAVRQFSAEAIQ